MLYEKLIALSAALAAGAAMSLGALYALSETTQLLHDELAPAGEVTGAALS